MNNISERSIWWYDTKLREEISIKKKYNDFSTQDGYKSFFNTEYNSRCVLDEYESKKNTNDNKNYSNPVNYESFVPESYHQNSTDFYSRSAGPY